MEHKKYKFNLGQEVCTIKRHKNREVPEYCGYVISRVDYINGQNKYTVSKDKTKKGKVFKEDELMFYGEIGDSQ